MTCKKYISLLSVLAAMLMGGAVVAQPSVLASGQWWKLRVDNSGVYRLGLAEVPALAGTPVSSIGIYGASGDQLPTDNALTPTSDLQPLAIDVVDLDGDGVFGSGDYILFFGEGTDVWRYDNSDARWELRRHAYATSNYYYLTTSASSPRRITIAPQVTADTVIDTYTAVAAVNNDLSNPFHTGQTWVGEKFSSGVGSRAFTLTLPDQASNIKLRYSLLYKGSLPGTFRISTTGLTTSHRFTADNSYGTWLEAIGATARTLSIAVDFTPGEATAEGYLDFIELSGRVPLHFAGSQLLARYAPMSRSAARYSVTGTVPRVWEVSVPGSERQMTLLNGTFYDSLSSARQYVLFNSATCSAPAAVTPIPNQDLHGSGQADLVVVCNQAFIEQASRLATLHEVIDDISTLVVTDVQVYNEFSSGKQDPMAIRSFLRHLAATHVSAPPRWLLLFGKASYDPRDILGNNIPTVVTYQTPFSYDDEGLSFCSDNMFGYLDPSESGSPSQIIDVGIGRLPAKTVAEADQIVNKLERYMTRGDLSEGGRGDWRNYVALLADDADPSRAGDTSFTHSSEYTATRIKQLFPSVNIDRLYADAYPQHNGAIGSYYPDLNNALRQRINYGCLVLNYVGHGSQKYIGTERYIEPSDLAAYTNTDRQPLLVASTCSYGWHDIPDDLCGAELALLAKGAAISVISAARPISHNQRFNTDVLLFALDPNNTIGDALRMARNNTAVPLCIELTGDPALHLSAPRNKVVVTQIGDHPVSEGEADTATVLSTVTVSGEIQDRDGNIIPDFDGTVFPIVFDRETRATTLANDNPGAEVAFMQQKSVLYKGSAPVTSGRFSYTFTVPRDVQYQYDYGRLSHYAVAGTDDAAGAYTNILFGGLNEDVAIAEVRPEIRLFMGDTNFRSGGLTDQSPTLLALLSDSVGINAFGSGLGHDITAVIDDNPGSLVVLNDFYSPDIDNPLSGQLRYTFADIAPGNHTLTLKAWNIWGYSSTATIAFCVRPDDEPTVSALSVAPNPASTYARFRCEVSNTEAVTSSLLQIYSSQGALVCTFAPTPQPGSQVLGPVTWDLSSVAPGIYLARLTVTLDSGETFQSTTKVIVR